MGCTHCDEITRMYVDRPGYGLVALNSNGDLITLPVARWATKEVLACDCHCHDIWKRWRPR